MTLFRHLSCFCALLATLGLRAGEETVRLGVTLDVNALATVIILFVSVGVIVSAMITRNTEDTSGAEHG